MFMSNIQPMVSKRVYFRVIKRSEAIEIGDISNFCALDAVQQQEIQRIVSAHVTKIQPKITSDVPDAPDPAEETDDLSTIAVETVTSIIVDDLSTITSSIVGIDNTIVPEPPKHINDIAASRSVISLVRDAGLSSERVVHLEARGVKVHLTFGLSKYQSMHQTDSQEYPTCERAASAVNSIADAYAIINYKIKKA